MLLPHWTDGCMASMEGLFFEASGTTPYHFLTTAAMSKQSSNPVRELRYDNNDASIGVPYLQALGVRYVMVRTPEAKAQAAAQPELELLATSGPWEIYQVADSDIVVPLDTQPVVVAKRPGDQRERNLELGTSWFQHRDEWAAIPADGGPEEWQRIDVAVDESRPVPDPQPAGRRSRHPRQAGRHRRARPRTSSPSRCPPIEVSDVEMGQQERVLPRRRGRRARAGQGQLLPELGRRRGRGAVPRRAQLDGRRADRATTCACTTTAAAPTCSSTSSRSPASPCWSFFRIRGDVDLGTGRAGRRWRRPDAAAAATDAIDADAAWRRRRRRPTTTSPCRRAGRPPDDDLPRRAVAVRPGPPTTH